MKDKIRFILTVTTACLFAPVTFAQFAMDWFTIDDGGGTSNIRNTFMPQNLSYAGPTGLNRVAERPAVPGSVTDLIGCVLIYNSKVNIARA
jgi:hypothetical protein